MRWEEILRESNKGKVLYHATDAVNEAGILTSGLHRKSKDWPAHYTDYDKMIAKELGDAVYDNRIFFFENFNQAEMLEYMMSVLSELHNKTCIPGEACFLVPFTVFAIDLAQLPDFEFHIDGDSNTPLKAVWTDSGDIPASALSVQWRCTENLSNDPSVQPLYNADGSFYGVK